MTTTSSLPDPRMPISVPAGFPHARVRACWIHAHTPSQGAHAHTHQAHTRMHRAHACLLAPGPHARSLAGPMHTCSHWVPTPTHSRGPSRTLAPGPHARLVSMHAHTGSPCPLARGVPTQARTGPIMHARTRPCMHARTGPCTHAPGPHARSLAGSPRKHAPGHACTLAPGHACTLAPGHACTLGLHACTHRAHARMLAPGPHAYVHPGLCTCTRTGPPCLLACGVPMHMRRIPALVHAASHIVCSSSYM